jgi:hypothetical protein
MASRLNTLAAILLFSTLCGCASDRSPLRDLSTGMSTDRVRDIMGEPDSTSANAVQGLCWYYSPSHGYWDRASADYAGWFYTCFKNERLNTYGRVGDRPKPD